MNRERALKVVLVVVALFFTAAIYPVIILTWSRDEAGYTDAAMLSLYFTVSSYLPAARKPTEHRSLIAFAAWSSLAHAGL
jgi:hypothetical protein